VSTSPASAAPAQIGRRVFAFLIDATMQTVLLLVMAAIFSDLVFSDRAIVAGHPGIVDSLVPDDKRAFTDEAWAPNPPAVRLMMELGFDPSMPSGSGPRGGTALHCAAWEGSVEAVEAIVDHERGRALVDAVEPNWNGTPLRWCCHGSTNCGNPTADHGGVVRRLVAAGATGALGAAIG